MGRLIEILLRENKSNIGLNRRCAMNFTLFSIAVLVYCGLVFADDEEWANSVNCRDNAHFPIDWWVIYKPPSRSATRRGRNFTFLTPQSEGRWEASEVYITYHSMLMNTIAPMFTDSLLQKNIAILIYSERPGEKGSSVQGILLADEAGGIWVTHTIPGFPKMNQEIPSFPETEMIKGHMMTCMSLDHAALDGIVKVISQANPLIQKIHMPAHMMELLPSWTAADLEPGNTKVVDFETRKKKLNPIMVVRKPGDNHCLFEMFAKAKKVVLDIYGDRNMNESFCYEEYGVRQIKSISVKFSGEVHYIDNSTDRATFAVSTAAHWQQRGAGPTQYWACIGSYEEPSVYPRGSMILCVPDYDLWVAFQNLKVNEPSC